MIRLAAVASILALTALCFAPAVAAPRPPEVPAKVVVSVEPEGVEPGGTARVVVRLEPIDGVKINRYPNVKLRVPATDGLVAASEGTIGSSEPPPPGETAGYFESVDPLHLELTLDANATTGKHAVEARLNYFYCMPKSGFCAPKRTSVKIPVTVR